jgi:hypothetical protein
MKELIRKEKEAGITPDPDVDTYMKVQNLFPLCFSMCPHHINIIYQ